MTPIEPTHNRGRRVPPGGGRPPGFLTTVATTLVRELDAAAAVVFLRASDARELRAAVVAVTPLGMGSVERVALDDDAYPSARALRSNSVVTVHGTDIMAAHPDLSVFAPFPLQVASAPISAKSRQFGTVTVFWQQAHDGTAQADIDRLAAAASDLAARFLKGEGPPEPPAVPFVVSVESGDTAADEVSTSSAVPLIYHVHKLAVLLAKVARTGEAIDLAMDRVISGFFAPAVVISLLRDKRLQIAGASGCSAEFIRTADWVPLGRSTPETRVVTGQRCVRHLGTDPPTRGRLVDPALEEHCDWLVYPLMAGGRCVGALSAAFDRRHYDVAVVKPALTALATVLAQAVERTQMHEARHALVEKLQEVLLPRMLPQPAGVVSTGRYSSAASGTQIGGDWYDLLRLPAGGVAMVIGDVEGHNPAAAAMMGQLASAVRAYANEGQGPQGVLERANRLLIGLDTDLYATCCCVWLDPDTGVAQFASAGHPLPLMQTHGRVVPPPDDLEVGVPLGIDPGARYAAAELTLDPDTMLACFTDGLVHPGSRADAEALETIMAGDADIETLGDQIMTRLAEHHASHADDAALLLVRYEGPSSQAQRTVRQLKIHRRDLRGTQRARKLLREWLDGWDLADMADEEELLVSEVVTNGLVHGDSDVHVVVRRYSDRVRVEVRDSDPHRARAVTLPRQEDEAEGGRGLMIVSALASAWGNSPSGRGKTVWFELPVPT